MCSRSFRSSAPKGSSSSSSVGSSTRLRAIATRCRWPPESASTRFWREPPSPTRSSMASTLRWRSARATPRRANPKATFSPTDIIGNRASCWNTILTGRRFGATPAILRPPMTISPPSGWINPAIMRSSVVLPHPDGPRIEKKLPRATLKERSSTATWSAKRLVTWRASRSGVVNGPP